MGNSQGAATGIGTTFSIFDPHARSPYVQQFSFDIQRELPWGIAVEAGFVGSKSSHMSLGAGTVNINALNPSLLSLGSALTQQVANPFLGKGGVGVVGTANVQASQLLLPYPTYGPINLLFTDNNKALYDSLILKGQKRLGNGLTLLSTLTWSRNWDESSGGVANTLNAGNKNPQNPYDMGAEYAFSNIDSPFRWATSISYQLPFGAGKPLLNRNGPLNYLVGGWSLNTVSIFQTGFPLQITQATNFNSAFGYASQRPNATGVSPVTSGGLEDRLNNYINPAAFSTAPQATFGNLYRTIDMRGPPGELGRVPVQRRSGEGAAQNPVPSGSAECHEHPAVLRPQRFLRQQRFWQDHYPGKLLAAVAVGAALLVLTAVNVFDIAVIVSL